MPGVRAYPGSHLSKGVHSHLHYWQLLPCFPSTQGPFAPSPSPYSYTSVSPVAQVPHITTRSNLSPRDPIRHHEIRLSHQTFLSLKSLPKPDSSGMLGWGLASWGKVNIPHTEQRTWQGLAPPYCCSGGGVQDLGWPRVGEGKVFPPKLGLGFWAKGTPGPIRERRKGLLSRISSRHQKAGRKDTSGAPGRWWSHLAPLCC